VKEAPLDSSGKRAYRSEKTGVLGVVAYLSGLSPDLIKSSDKKASTRAREIIVLLLSQGMRLSDAEVGRFLNQTGKGAKNHRVRGARRLRSDEEFAHTFAEAEIRSNTHIRSGA
jgi:hypothetical protein